MAVYVDPAKLPYKGMLMCHMVADTEEELHAMADKLGIARAHYHAFHYNITKSSRVKAIQLGAIKVTTRIAVLVRRKLERAVTGNCSEQPTPPKPYRVNIKSTTLPPPR